MSDRRGSLFLDDAPDSRPTPVPVPAPATAGEIIGAHWRLGRQDMAGAPLQAEIDAYGPIVTELMKHNQQSALDVLMHGDRYYTAARQGNPVSTNNVWADVAARRAEDPAFMKDIPATNADEFTKWVKAEELKRRRAAQDVASRAQGAGQAAVGFATDIGTGFTDPINLASMALTGGAGGAKTLVQVMAREALINAATEVAELPSAYSNRAAFGEKMTATDMGANVLAAGVAGAIFPVGQHLAGKGLKAVADGPVGQMAGRAVAPLALKTAQPLPVPDTEVARAFSDAVPAEIRTPDEQAAMHVIQRQAEIDEANPFVGNVAGRQAHADRLTAAMQGLLAAGDRSGAIPPPARAAAPRAPIAPVAATPDARAAFKRQVRGAESGGNDAAKASGSTATGRYQFTAGTWKPLYIARYGRGGLTDAQISAKRLDPNAQEALMDDLTAQHAASLKSMGVAETPGNLYLMHFAGSKGGPDILRAAPDTPIERVLSPSAIKANKFLRGKTAGEVIEWAHHKMGSVPDERVHLDPAKFADDEELKLAQRALEDANAEADRGARGEAAPERAVVTDGQTAPEIMASGDGAPARASNEVDGGAENAAPPSPLKSNVLADAVSDAIIGPIYLEPKGAPGIALEVGRGATAAEHAERAVVMRNEAGEPVASLRFNLRENADGTFDPAHIERRDEHYGGVTTYVKPEYRRQGVATQLYDFARAQGLDIDKVSGAHDLTPDGAAFASARRARSMDRGAPEPLAASPSREIDHAPTAAEQPAFDHPDGPEAAAQVASIDHDLRLALEVEPDAAFRLGDDEAPRSLASILEEQDAEEAAIEAVRGCL